MARRTKEEAKQTREAVLKAALDIFYEKGYTRTTFDEIARRIELTKGAVYWHFRNKADLLAALIKQKFYDKDIEKMDLVKSPQTLSDLRKIVCIETEQIEQDADFRKFLFFIIFQMEWSEAIYQKIGEQVRDIRDYPMLQLKETLTFLQKSGEISADVSVDELALTFICFWRGTVSAYISKIFPFVLSQQMAKGFDLIMSSVKTEKNKCV